MVNSKKPWFKYHWLLDDLKSGGIEYLDIELKEYHRALTVCELLGTVDTDLFSAIQKLHDDSCTTLPNDSVIDSW